MGVELYFVLGQVEVRFLKGSVERGQPVDQYSVIQANAGTLMRTEPRDPQRPIFAAVPRAPLH